MTSSSIHNTNDDDFEATSTYAAVNNVTNGSHTTAVAGRGNNNERFRSPCVDIPDAARGWTWSDSFYNTTTNNNDDIIAAFDIDRTIHDRPTFEFFKCLFLIPAFFILAVSLPVFLIDGWKSTIPLLITLSFIHVFIFLPNFLIADCMRSAMQRRISCTHVAVGTRGLYIDLVDSPGSHNLMNRTRISYDEILKCKVVSQYNFFHGMMAHRIYIRTKDDLDCTGLLPDNIVDLIASPKHVLEGIKSPQKYVDIVNAMMVRHAHLTTTTTPAMNTGMEVA